MIPTLDHNANNCSYPPGATVSMCGNQDAAKAARRWLLAKPARSTTKTPTSRSSTQSGLTWKQCAWPVLAWRTITTTTSDDNQSRLDGGRPTARQPFRHYSPTEQPKRSTGDVSKRSRNGILKEKRKD